ncbi:MAG: serine/threonine protein kinase, partial [Anaerolineae bacterium]
RESSIKCLDLPAMNKLYGTDPLFIFDPNDDSNHPVEGFHDNALAFWPLYPAFIRELFTEAFTEGLHDPQERIRESEWRGAMARMRDAIIYCPKCGSENFYSAEKLRATGNPGTCWACNTTLVLPPRIRIDDAIVMLNWDTKLYPHHVDTDQLYDFSKPIAEVNQHPNDPSIWGLRNLSDEKWVITTDDGAILDVDPGRNVRLAVGTKVNFGKKEGEIRV